MHACDLTKNVRWPSGYWVADWSCAGECDYDDPVDVLEMHQPVLQFSMSQILNEITYQQLMRKPGMNTTFLDQDRRIGTGQGSTKQYGGEYTLRPRTVWNNPRSKVGPFYLRGISYQGFNGDTMIFYVTPSSESPEKDKPVFYQVSIKFLQWDDIGTDSDFSPYEKAVYLLQSSDIQLDCTDPSFKYWGFQYILSMMAAAIEPEMIPPNENNPGRQGIVCKHLRRVLSVLPFYVNDIMVALRNQWGGRIDYKAIQAIKQRAKAQQDANKEFPELPPEQELPPEAQEPGPDQMGQQPDQTQQATEIPNENPANPRSTNRRLPNSR